jgi:hypothetical protein
MAQMKTEIHFTGVPVRRVPISTEAIALAYFAKFAR